MGEDYGKIYDDANTGGFFSASGLSKEEYLKQVAEWQRREISKEDAEKMRKAMKELIDYVMGCFSGKGKFDKEKFEQLQNAVKEFKPENFPLKKEAQL